MNRRSDFAHVAALIPLILAGSTYAINAYSGYEAFPFYRTASSIPRGGWYAGVSITPWEFEHYPSGCDDYFFFEPELSVRYGVCDHGDIGFNIYPDAPGFGIDGIHQFSQGNMDWAAGGRASYSWYNSFNAGRLEISPRVIVSNDEKPKPVPYAVNLGLSYNLNRSSYGTEGGSSVGSTLGIVGGVGIPYKFDFDSRQFKVQPEIDLHLRVWNSSSLSYTPTFEGSAGVELSYRF